MLNKNLPFHINPGSEIYLFTSIYHQIFTFSHQSSNKTASAVNASTPTIGHLRLLSHGYVCMYVCVYVCMYVCMYVYMYGCMYVYMYVCMYVSRLSALEN